MASLRGQHDRQWLGRRSPAIAQGQMMGGRMRGNSLLRLYLPEQNADAVCGTLANTARLNIA
jgi:hypothetical protein